jgi:hypothetical protein
MCIRWKWVISGLIRLSSLPDADLCGVGTMRAVRELQNSTQKNPRIVKSVGLGMVGIKYFVI